MTTKKLKAGSEVAAYCTKCKLDLGHRIIAMVDDTIKKVECQTCKSSHLYRRPASEREAAHAQAAERRAAREGGATRASSKSTKTSKGSKSATRSGASAQQREQELTAYWESAIAGKPASAFRSYRISEVFEAGDLLRHSKFGDGVVVSVIDKGKVEVIFQDGPRTMAHGQP